MVRPALAEGGALVAGVVVYRLPRVVSDVRHPVLRDRAEARAAAHVHAAELGVGVGAHRLSDDVRRLLLAAAAGGERKDYRDWQRSPHAAMMPDVATEDLTRVLDDAGVSYELLEHSHTESATAEAEALGLSPDDVAKTLVVTTPDGYVRAVIPASCRIDMRKLGDLEGTGRKKVHLATEDDMRRDYPDFDLGAVPPIGGGRRDPVVVDSRLADRGSIVLEAGSHEQSVRLSGSDLVRAANAQIADICQD